MIRRAKRMKTSQIDAAMEMLRSAGRNGDTELAHVNPREKAILKALGGAGSRNPRTGLREYFDGRGPDAAPPGYDPPGYLDDPDYITQEDLRRIDEAEAGSLRAMDAESLARAAGSSPEVLQRHKSAYDEAYRILHDLISEIASKGRYGDTEVVPTTPRDRAILKGLGGAGTVNPRTGLREYYDEGGSMSSDGMGAPGSVGTGDVGLGEGTNVGAEGLGAGPSFGNESGQGGGQIADLPQQDQEAIGRGGLIAGQNEVALSGLGAVGRSMGRALDSGDYAPGAGLFSLVGAGMAELGRQARSAYGPDFVADPTFEGGRQREAFMGGPDFPGNRAGGDGLAMALGAVPVSAPTPRYLRGGEMAAPQEISSFIGPGMTDLQQRALISTYGTQGVNSAFRTDPVRRYYANLLSRGLISDAGAPVQNPYVLPIEQQYASQVLGRPMTNPSDAAAAYESIRGLL
jgi:hypothetical protein